MPSPPVGERWLWTCSLEGRRRGSQVRGGLDAACAIGAGVCVVALTSGTGAPTTRDVMPDPGEPTSTGTLSAQWVMFECQLTRGCARVRWRLFAVVYDQPALLQREELGANHLRLFAAVVLGGGNLCRRSVDTA